LDPIKIRKCLENGNPSWNCCGEWRDTTAEGTQADPATASCKSLATLPLGDLMALRRP